MSRLNLGLKAKIAQDIKFKLTNACRVRGSVVVGYVEEFEDYYKHCIHHFGGFIVEHNTYSKYFTAYVKELDKLKSPVIYCVESYKTS